MEEMRSTNLDDIKEILKGRKIVASMFCGEIGWFLQYYQAYLRYLKVEVYKDYDFIIMCNKHLHYFVDDFASFTLDLPDWFYNLGLDQDCNEAVLPNSNPGSLTPPEVYQNLLLLLHELCEYAEQYELLLPPRGCNTLINTRHQGFCKFVSSIPDSEIKTDRPIVVVMPRARVRANNRNVPEFVWKELVAKLSETFTVVLAGSPSGACLGYLQGDNIVNLINYVEEDKTEKIVKYLNRAVCSVGSQSGGTHISLLSGCCSYIIGHEKNRHTIELNRLDVPTSFRVVMDYRAIDADTIVNDVREFIDALIKSNWFSKINRPSLITLEKKKNLVGVEIGTDTGLNALNILENLDIKTLYLIDPYSIYRDLKNIGCNLTEEQCIRCEKEAHDRLEKYSDKIVWIKDLSENAIDLIPDELDFVYVDGNHRKEYVLKDIELYYPKLKEGGLISFHDYDYKDVKEAVNEKFSNVNCNSCSDNRDRQEAWVIKPTNVDKILHQDYNKLIELINVNSQFS